MTTLCIQFIIDRAICARVDNKLDVALVSWTVLFDRTIARKSTIFAINVICMHEN